ncbi:MAG TPA: hypothetical protein VMT50_01400 [Steroidobacteraceae bacterium]|nr:hypothetical protein [Steroidobacteraceae bacterium]
MSMAAELQSLLSTMHLLERAVTDCKFDQALRLQGDLQARIADFIHARHNDPQIAPALTELHDANGHLLQQAEEARRSLLVALLQLGRQRRAAEGYASLASLR